MQFRKNSLQEVGKSLLIKNFPRMIKNSDRIDFFQEKSSVVEFY